MAQLADKNQLEAIRDAQIAHSSSCDAQHEQASEERKELRACVHRIEGQCTLILTALQSAQKDNGTQDARIATLESVRREASSSGKTSGATAGTAAGALVSILTYIAQTFLK